MTSTIGVAVHAMIRSRLRASASARRALRVRRRRTRRQCRDAPRSASSGWSRLEKAAAEHLLLGPPDRPLEALVHGVADHRRLVVDDNEQARGRVRDVAQEVALAVQLHLAELALGDVEAAEDDVAGVARLVGDRRRQPRDHHRLAAPVDERVLPACRRRGRGRPRSGAQRLPLLGRDEDVPEGLWRSSSGSSRPLARSQAALKLTIRPSCVERRAATGRCRRSSRERRTARAARPGDARCRARGRRLLRRRRRARGRTRAAGRAGGADPLSVALDVTCRPRAAVVVELVAVVPRRSARAPGASTRSRATGRGAPWPAPRAAGCRGRARARRSADAGAGEPAAQDAGEERDRHQPRSVTRKT